MIGRCRKVIRVTAPSGHKPKLLRHVEGGGQRGSLLLPSRCTCRPSSEHRLNGVHDRLVSGTSAEVAGERLANLLAIELTLSEQFRGRR